jgi:hypothetical protein
MVYNGYIKSRHTRETEMKTQIISTEVGHIIHRDDRTRGFQISVNGRMRSFGSVAAAVSAKKESLADIREMTAIIEASRIV